VDCGEIRLEGIAFPGNGSPLVGSETACERSPLRIAWVGIRLLFVLSLRLRVAW
jgi:hypothetical protein